MRDAACPLSTRGGGEAPSAVWPLLGFSDGHRQRHREAALTRRGHLGRPDSEAGAGIAPLQREPPEGPPRRSATLTTTGRSNSDRAAAGATHLAADLLDLSERPARPARAGSPGGKVRPPHCDLSRDLSRPICPAPRPACPPCRRSVRRLDWASAPAVRPALSAASPPPSY